MNSEHAGDGSSDTSTRVVDGLTADATNAERGEVQRYLGRIQRVDEPQEGTLVFSLYLPRTREKAFIVLTSDGAFITDSRPKGRPADSVIVRLRRELNGTWLGAVETRGPETRLRIERRDDTLFLTMHRTSFLLRDSKEQRVVGRVPHVNALAEHGWQARPLDSLRRFVSKKPVNLEIGERLVRKKLKKTRRTQKKVTADMARADRVDALRHEANLLMAHAHEKPHEGAIEVTDWETGALRRFEVRGTVSEAAQVRYAQAKRFERGKQKALERLKALGDDADRLEVFLADLAAETITEENVEARLGALGIRLGTESRRQKGKRGPNRNRVPYRTFLGPHGKIFVGRGAKDNDELTLKVARPFDHWLHVRGRPGSHVVIPLTRGAEVGSALLLDGAHLAAHFSSAAGDAVIEVDHLPRRHLRKVKGAAPGSVTLIRSKTITIRVDEARLRALLATEVR